MNAKLAKVLAHKVVDCDISIWVDANISLAVEPEKLVSEVLKENDMAVFKHPLRSCVYDEAEVLFGIFKDDPHVTDPLKRQIEKYHQSGWPPGNGLFECNVLIRRHIEKVAKFNEAWWAEICSNCQRDQISFPVILSQSGLKVSVMMGDVRNHPLFKFNHHSGPSN
jgi:hypothetical protein